MVAHFTSGTGAPRSPPISATSSAIADIAVAATPSAGCEPTTNATGMRSLRFTYSP